METFISIVSYGSLTIHQNFLPCLSTFNGGFLTFLALLARFQLVFGSALIFSVLSLYFVFLMYHQNISREECYEHNQPSRNSTLREAWF